MNDLTAEQISALADRAKANVAADPDLFDQCRAIALEGLDEYRKAHVALGFAIEDLGVGDVVPGSEAMALFRLHAEQGDFLMEEAGRAVLFGISVEDGS